MKTYTDRSTAPLKFHKFLKWFSLPLGAFVSIGNVLLCFTDGTAFTYYFDTGYYILYAILTIVSLVGMWRWKPYGPYSLYARQALDILNYCAMVIGYISVGRPLGKSLSNLVTSVIAAAIFWTYYKKRMPLFGSNQSSGSVTKIPFSLRAKLFLAKIFAPNSLTARTMETISQPGNEAMRDSFYKTHTEAEKFSRPLVLTGNLLDDICSVKERKDYYANQVETLQEMLDFGAIKESEKGSFLRDLQNSLENLQETSLIWGAIMPLYEEEPDPYVLSRSELEQARNIQSRIHQKYLAFLACGGAIAALGNVSDQDPELRLLKSKESRLKDDMEQLVEDLGAIYYP